MLTDRMIRAAKLDIRLFEEVEADTTATSQAFLVILVVAVANGVGFALAAREVFVGALVGGVVSFVLFWLAWSFITYYIGTTFLGGTATWGELLRTIGFATSPGVLYILRFIPVLGELIALVVFIWILVAAFIALRQALDVTTGIAIVTVVAGIIVYVLLSIVLGLLIFGAGAAGG